MPVSSTVRSKDEDLFSEDSKTEPVGREPFGSLLALSLSMPKNGIILRTQSLCKFFLVKKSKGVFSLFPEQITVKAVNEVDFDVKEGETYAIVGESGSGKTTLGYMVARIFEPTSGRIWLHGEDITHIKDRELRALRRKVQMVFQDPGSSLNPRQTIESIVSLPLKIYTSLSRKEIKTRVAGLLEAVHLPVELMRRYPGTLSGGQKQRVSIARALALNPKLFILDEPTSALDVSVQAIILNFLMVLKKELGLTYVFITHDLGVVKNLSDKIAVMYLGRIIEMAKTAVVFRNPIHPYTKALLSAIPVIKDEEKQVLPKEVVLDGDIPSPANPPKTCSFLSRCQEKREICEKSPCPDLVEVEENHFVRCLI